MTKYNITYKSHNWWQNYVICTKLEKETSNPSSNSTSCPTTYDSNRADADVASKKIASDLYFVVQE